VSFLHRGQVGVDLGEPGIRFTGRHRTILRRAVDFVLPVLEISRGLTAVAHECPPRTRQLAHPIGEILEIVTRDVPDEVFAAGNPCRVIRDITE